VIFCVDSRHPVVNLNGAARIFLILQMNARQEPTQQYEKYNNVVVPYGISQSGKKQA
jgi:hypothetical protein